MSRKPVAAHLVAFATVAIDLLGFGIVLPLLPLYGDRLLGDVDPLWHGPIIGLLLSSFSAMQFLCAPGWGRLSDRIGRRPVLMIGLGGSVVFYGLFAYASWIESLALLFVSRIGAGIAGATIGTAQAVIADSTPPERRASGMALIGMAFGLGFTVGPVVGSFLAGTQAGLSPAPGLAAAGLSLAALLFAFMRLPETRPEGARPRRSWLDWASWRSALARRATAVPLLLFFTATLAFAIFEGTVARFARDVLLQDLEPAEQFQRLGLLFAYIGVVLMLTQGLLVRRLAPRIGEIAMTRYGLTLMIAGLLLAAIAVSDPADVSLSVWQGGTLIILLAMALAVVGFAFLTPSLQALLSKRTSAWHQGETLGVNQAAAAIARILGPLLGNSLYGSQTAPRPTWPLSAGSLLIGIALVVGWSRLEE